MKVTESVADPGGGERDCIENCEKIVFSTNFVDVKVLVEKISTISKIF